MKHKHCGYCGTEFAITDWPRTCAACQNITYKNPLPVAVCVQPIRDGERIGLAIAQRAIPPFVGSWTLIGGHIEGNGESAEQGAIREFEEETSVSPGSNPRLYGSQSNAHGHMLLFVEFDPIDLSEFEEGKPCEENLALDVLWEPTTLGFPIHTNVAMEWFSRNG